MICPKCSGEWKTKRKPMFFGSLRKVCVKCGYADPRMSWEGDVYKGPPELVGSDEYNKVVNGHNLADTMFKKHTMPCCNKPISEVGYREGPSGGMCTNIMCGGCGEKWNISPSIGYVEKI